MDQSNCWLLLKPTSTSSFLHESTHLLKAIMYAHLPRDRQHESRQGPPPHCQVRTNYQTLNIGESPTSPTSSDSSIDEEEVNKRMQPFWPKYQSLFKSRGLRLDTVRDVKAFYGRRSQQPPCLPQHGFNQNEDSLCPDAGLVRCFVFVSELCYNSIDKISREQPDNLFRGTRIPDSKRFVVKAVHAGSREFEVIYALSCPPLRDDPMNHTIRSSLPLLNLILHAPDH